MRGLDQQPAGVRLPLARDVPVAGLPLAGLADPRVQARDSRPGDAGSGIASTSPITPTIASAVIAPTPGIVISRRTSALASACSASDAFGELDLGVQRVMQPQVAVDLLALVRGQLDLGKPAGGHPGRTRR